MFKNTVGLVILSHYNIIHYNIDNNIGVTWIPNIGVTWIILVIVMNLVIYYLVIII